MNALVIDPSFPMVMRPQAPTKIGSFGAGGLQARRGSVQPYYDFEIGLRFRDQESADEFLGFMAYHQKDTAMKFDGGVYGDIRQPVIIGYGNGTQTQFFLPRRNVQAASWVIMVNGVITAATITEASGMAVLGAAPPLNALITGYGRNWFKVVVKDEGNADMFDVQDISFNVFEAPRLLLSEVA